MGEFLDVLRLQPDFKVLRSTVPNFREEITGTEESLPAGEFQDLSKFIKRYHPRARITKVEIEYSIDALDVARITIVDPEYEVFSLLNWDYIWQVGIGYAGLPESEWATFVGVPQIELPRYPKDGEPTITIVLLGVTVRMTKHHTFNPPVINDFICAPADIAEVRKAPRPIHSAIERIANSHGLIAYFGVEKEGDALVEVDKNHQPDEVLDRVFPLASTDNDAQYLDRIVKFLNDWEADKLRKQPPQEKKDAIPVITNEIGIESQRAVLALEKSEYRWGQLGNRLVVAKWKRDIFDSEFGLGGSRIPVFQYRCGNMALLEFTPRISRAMKEKGFQIMGINKFSGKVEYSGITEEGKLVEDIVPLNLEDPRVVKETYNLRENEAKRDYLLLTSVGPDQREAYLDLARLWEISGINITGEAELIGYPKLRAGMLIGLGGLGRTADVEPTGKTIQKQKFFSLNRIYVTERVTHTLDVQTGKYRVHVLVASSDSDRYGRDKIFDEIARGSLDKQDQMGNTFIDAWKIWAEGATEARP